MYYFGMIDNTLSLKNNLEKDIFKMIKQNDRIVIPEKIADNFMAAIIAGIEELNKKYPRCHPVKASFLPELSSEGDFYLEGIYAINFYLRKSKN